MTIMRTLVAVAFGLALCGCGRETESDAFQDVLQALENPKIEDAEVKVVTNQVAGGEWRRVILVFPMSNAVPSDVERMVSVKLTNLLGKHPGLGYTRDGTGWKVLVP